MEECRYFSDFFCNYIGFHSRHQLEQYVEFYLPLIGYFFDRDYHEIRPVSDYTQRVSDVQRGAFRAIFVELLQKSIDAVAQESAFRPI